MRSVHSPAELLPAAYELARQFTSETSAVSVALARAMLWRMLGESHPMAAHRVDSALLDELGRSDDVKEGVLSFLEKRRAAFLDRVPTHLPTTFPWWSEPRF